MREMKDSGIEWIGEIPKEWDLIKCKYVTEVYTGNSIKDEEKGLYEDPVDSIPYISTKDIDATFNSVAYDNGLFIKKIDTSFVRANKGDTLMCIEGGSAGRKKAILDRTVCFVNKLCCFHPTRINPVYLFYILNSPHYEEEFSVNMSGLIGGVSKGKLMNFILPYPCYDTQHRIADYLDDKCGKIDRYIEQQKQVIEKLKAYKQSVITEAVTKGLDPTVPMKDSGVEWIGEIPESWVVVKATRLILSTQNGLTRRDLEKSNGNIVLKLRNINSRGEIDYSEINRIVLSSKEVETYQLIDGDFLFVRVNGSRSLVGKCAIYNGISEIVAYNDHIIRVRLNNFCDKDFFKWFLLSDVGKKEIDIHTSTSAGQFTISGDGLRNLNVILPKKEIQREIVVYLNQKCSSIDFAIAEKQNLIEKLTEYKKSLIYEVVTGKKEV